MNVIFIIFSLFFTVVKSSEMCEVCQNLVKEFHKRLKESENQNFGGGNTAWEESRLGSYVTSETRLIDIVDGLCPAEVDRRERCQRMREEVEEELERWWITEFRKDRISETLYGALCVNHLKVCCLNLQHGEDCKPCHFQEEGVVCSGRGICNGNGTREGDGSCICDKGYSGEACKECSDGHYKLTDNMTCLPCDKSCLQCTGPSESHCETCASGFQKEELLCVDVNECQNNTVCDSSHYCNNTFGSYECILCDKSCSKCTGEGSTKCLSCNQGYQSVQGSCEDINECSADSQLCRETGQQCTNTEGSYTCDCMENYTKQQNGTCALKVIESKDHLSSSSNNNNKKSQTSNNKAKNKRQTKKIWTRKFEREFFKLIVCISLLVVVSYFFGRYKPFVLVAGVVCGYFVYHKSINLDLIFSKSVYI